MTFFLQKMIFVETQYEIQNKKLMTIITAFKTWRYYLEDYKYKLFILIDNNNFYQFIDIKSLSFCQMR